MKNGKSLIETNPYLRDEKVREELIMEHAITSARIEGVRGALKLAEQFAKRSRSSLSTKKK
ncbi:MAG: hypothetical protein HYZ34_08065 [Ignavibacteriae bacterium]|nr:hypothetical protein [Ignavibacteriota bacterium]